MKALLGTLLTVTVLVSSPAVLANNCQSIAKDLYTAQGYQQRCGYQLKQTPVLAANLKQTQCDQKLSGADKNKLLNSVNQELNQAFQTSKKDSCDAGKSKYN